VPTKAGEGAKERSGGRPDWVDGASSTYPAEQWLCGVGFARDRGAAENGSLAALARVFKASVESTSQDFLGAYQKTGAQQLEVSSIENLTRVSTDKVFSGVRVLEVWNDGNSTIYALACLDREQAGAALRAQIGDADVSIGKYLADGRRTQGADRLRSAGRALDGLVQRESLNSELRIIDARGIGMQSPYSHADVVAALEAAMEALRVGVQASGEFDSDFRTALIQGLTQRGYKVSEGATGDLDVLVVAVIRVEDGGPGTGSASALHFARGVVQLEVKNPQTQKTIAAFNESRKEGHRNFDEAKRRAVRQLATQLTGPVGAKIDASLKGK
jgi:hypothetical protein